MQWWSQCRPATKLDHFAEPGTGRQQLVVRAWHDKAAVVDRDDLLTKSARGQAMGDDAQGAIGNCLLEGGNHRLCRDSIERTGRLVRSQQGGLPVEGPGKSAALALATSTDLIERLSGSGQSDWIKFDRMFLPDFR